MLEAKEFTKTIQNVIKKTDNIRNEPDLKKRAEYALLLSNLFLGFSKRTLTPDVKQLSSPPKHL
jgi:hypothetical protein